MRFWENIKSLKSSNIATHPRLEIGILGWRICNPANAYHLEVYKSGILELEGIPRDYLVWTPQFAAGETETWSGVGTVSSHTVKMRQKPGLLTPALGSPFPPLSCYFGGGFWLLSGERGCRWKSAWDATAAGGCLSFTFSWKTSFRYDWVSQADQMGNCLECVGRWWRVWLTEYPRRCGTLWFPAIQHVNGQTPVVWACQLRFT